MKVGTTELLLILGVALIIFGPTKLPQLGKAMGETIKNFKKGVEYEEKPVDVNAEDDTRL